MPASEGYNSPEVTCTNRMIGNINDNVLKVENIQENGECEVVYKPNTYTITFKHSLAGALINNGSYDYGCGIMNSAPTTYHAKMSGFSSWASNTFILSSISNGVETVTLTFKATSFTAYWVWNMANLSDSTNATINVDITKFSATHSTNNNITYYEVGN